jgi:hypothetical protein
MITIVTSGGLGNQLFQYAAARHLADSLGEGLVVDTRNHPRDADWTKRFWIDRLPIRARIRRYAAGGPLAPSGIVSRAVRRVWIERRRRVMYADHPGFDPALMRAAKPGAVLHGYFQSVRYLGTPAEARRLGIHLDDVLGAAHRDWTARIDAERLVSVHVRRGDYIGNPRYELRAPLTYFAGAMDALRRQDTAATRFLVFSDDIAWCRHQPVFASDCAFYEEPGGARAWPGVELALMSRCAGHIISNSTYSWWAAWLGDDGAKPIVAPRSWIGGGTIDEWDLRPPRWMTI